MRRNLLVFAVLFACFAGAWLAWRLVRSDGVGDPSPSALGPAREETGAAAGASRPESRSEAGSSLGDARRAAAVDDVRSANETSLLVRLRWSGGEPAAGVGVRLAPENGGDPFLEEATKIADERGEARFTGLEPGPVAVEVDRGVSARATLVAGKETVVTIELPSVARIEGRVVDAKGNGVAAASVWVYARTDGGKKGNLAAKADERGAFVLAGLTGERWVGARSSAHAPSGLHRVVADENGATPKTLTLVLPGPGAGLRGIVLDGEERPVHGARVRIGSWLGLGLAVDAYERTRNRDAPAALFVDTDAGGRFEVDGVPEGAEAVSVRRKGFAPWAELVRFVAGEVREITVILRRGVAVRGTVRDPRGQPIEGVSVVSYGRARFQEAQARTNARGEFRFTDLAGERIRLSATKTGWQDAKAVLEGMGSDELRWDPVLSPSLTLRGRLVDGDRKPLVGCAVVLVVAE